MRRAVLVASALIVLGLGWRWSQRGTAPNEESISRPLPRASRAPANTPLAEKPRAQWLVRDARGTPLKRFEIEVSTLDERSLGHWSFPLESPSLDRWPAGDYVLRVHALQGEATQVLSLPLVNPIIEVTVHPRAGLVVAGELEGPLPRDAEVDAISTVDGEPLAVFALDARGHFGGAVPTDRHVALRAHDDALGTALTEITPPDEHVKLSWARNGALRFHLSRNGGADVSFEGDCRLLGANHHVGDGDVVWGIPSGTCSIVARNGNTVAHATASVKEEDAAEVTLDFAPAVTLTGRVHDPDGRPVAGARVFVGDDPGSSLRREPAWAETSSTGDFRLDQVAIGDSVVLTHHDYSIPASMVPPDGQLDLTATPRPLVTVQGRVHEPGGRAVPAFDVRWRNDDFYESELRHFDDPDGRFHFEVRGSTSMWLEFSAEGYFPAQLSGDAATAFDVELKPSHLVRGQVFGPDGNPRPLARVECDRCSSSVARTDAQGRFSIGISDGALPTVVRASMASLVGAALASDQPVTLVLGPPAGLTVRLPSACDSVQWVSSFEERGELKSIGAHFDAQLAPGLYRFVACGTLMRTAAQPRNPSEAWVGDSSSIDLVPLELAPAPQGQEAVDVIYVGEDFGDTTNP